MQRLPVYILAGGKSSRFGSDKARAMVGDVTLLEHVVKLVSGHASRVTAVAETAGKYADLGLRTIGDAEPGRGPLGGLAAALEDLAERGDGGRLLLCTCDMVVMEAAWLTRLLEAAADGDVEAVAFKGEYWQPMPGVYGVLLAARVEKLVQGDGRSMQGLLAGINTRPLAMPLDWPKLWQVNRQSDLERFGEAQR